jgi:hypothetical protein
MGNKGMWENRSGERCYMHLREPELQTEISGKGPLANYERISIKERRK